MRTKRLAIAAAGGIAYAGIVLLGASLLGQTAVSPEHAFPATPSQVAEMIRDMQLLLAAGLGLITGAALYQD